MSEKREAKKGFTRRQIIKGAPLGIAAAAAFGLVAGRLIPGYTRRANDMPDLPEDSIFAPDRNRYPKA